MAESCVGLVVAEPDSFPAGGQLRPRLRVGLAAQALELGHGVVAVQLLLHGRLPSVVLDGFHPLDPPRRGGDDPLVRVVVASGRGAVGQCGGRGGDQVRVPIEAGLVTVDHLVDERLGVAVAALGGVEHDHGCRQPGDTLGPVPSGQHGTGLFDQRTGLVEAALADQCHPPGTGELALR